MTLVEQQRASPTAGGPTPAHAPPGQSTPRLVRRLRVLVGAVALTALAFIQEPGRITSDTKIDLAIDPVHFLSRATRLWEPLTGFGQLQNQAYGYLFPMGPFFAGGDVVGLPAWVVQRGWLAAILVVAYLGTVRLAGVLGIGTPLVRILAGIAYALSPRMLTILGPISSDALPMALLPWTLVPLVLGARGLLDPRRAAGLSGLAILGMSGINAAATLAVLPLPALWLLTREAGPLRGRLLAWWSLVVPLACLWWLLPLVLLGRYSFPFLDYIESSVVTTSRTSLVEVLRGTSHWVGYLQISGEHWWRATEPLVTNPIVVLQTGLLAAGGLLGLSRPDLPHRRFLVLGLLCGLVAVTAGHVGPMDGAMAGSLREALDGPLVPFRNVHKFQPLVTLPLILGLCHAVSCIRLPSGVHAAAALAAALVVGAASPALAGQLPPAGSFEEVPAYWRQAADWLGDHAGADRTLVLPADGFARMTWGRTVDEPLQPLARTPWAVRNQAAPLGGTGTMRLLDEVERRIDSGQPSPGLAPYLARAGIRYVAVRNDLDVVRSGAPRPLLVRATLSGSPGFRLAAVFGPDSGGPRVADVLADSGLRRPAPPVEVYEVDGDVSPVAVYPSRGAVVLSGGPENLLEASAQGLLRGRPVLLAGDAEAGRVVDPSPLVTDGLRRREVNYGGVRGNTSATLTADEKLRRPLRVPDALPVAGAEHFSTARYDGARSIEASSSASDANADYDRSAAHLPFAALDGDPATRWLSGRISRAGDQWWEVHLDRATSLPSLTLTPARGNASQTPATLVRVTTDSGSAVTGLNTRMVPQTLVVPPGETRLLRVSVESFRGGPRARGMFGIAELTWPGRDVRRTVTAPDDLPSAARGAEATYVFAATTDRADGCVTTDGITRCATALETSGEEAGTLDRTFVVHDQAELLMRVSARAVGNTVLSSVATGPVRAQASSQLVRSPAASATAAIDGDSGTGWIAATDDERPALDLNWGEQRTVGSIEIAVSSDLAASRPARLRVTGGGISRDAVFERVEAAAPPRGVTEGQSRDVIRLVATFEPMQADRVELTFPAQDRVTSIEPTFGAAVRLPVGISEVVIPGITEEGSAGADRTVSVPCGAGPHVEVDGVAMATSGSATQGSLARGGVVELRPCDSSTVLDLQPGEHRVRVTEGGSGFEAVAVVLRPPALQTQSPANRTSIVRTWQPERRVVDVGAGEASYLVVRENANSGWRASLDGEVLRTTRVDGWQQAFALPAGAGGRVEITYGPAVGYRLALAIGGVAAMLVLALALFPARPRRRSRPVGEGTGAFVPAVGAAAALIIVGGIWGLIALAAALVVRRHVGRHVRLLPGLLLAVAGGLASVRLVEPQLSAQLVEGATQPICLFAIACLVVEVVTPDGRWWGPAASGPPTAAPQA